MIAPQPASQSPLPQGPVPPSVSGVFYSTPLVILLTLVTWRLAVAEAVPGRHAASPSESPAAGAFEWARGDLNCA